MIPPERYYPRPDQAAEEYINGVVAMYTARLENISSANSIAVLGVVDANPHRYYAFMESLVPSGVAQAGLNPNGPLL
ncbi:MAG TPA: hypothetical protein VI756_27745 [Blastocatellia bacterium]